MTCEFATLDGAYLLGVLPAAERADYERHLVGCDACTRSMREIAGLPGLLARVPLEVVEPEHIREEAPHTLLPALMAQVRRERRRRTTTTVVAAAAAVVLLLGGFGVVRAVSANDEPTTTAPAPTASLAPSQSMQPVGYGGVTGWVSLTAVPWGTRIDLTCGYAGEPGAVWTYQMVVRTVDGAEQAVGSWRAESGSEAHVTMATAATPDEIALVEVRTGDGTSVLRLRPTH